MEVPKTDRDANLVIMNVCAHLNKLLSSLWQKHGAYPSDVFVDKERGVVISLSEKSEVIVKGE